MRRGAVAPAVAVLGLAAALAVPGPALAAQDTLAGGSVQLSLKSSKKLKLKPRNLNLGISGGRLDPVSGEGTVDARGKLRARRSKRKAKVTILSLTFGANGGPGRIDARVGKNRVNRFGTLRGGATTRAGFGAQISGVTARLTGRGAKALNRAFFGKKKKKKKKRRGKASAAARGKGKGKGKGKRLKGGIPLGTIDATTVPKTVEVLPGGTLTLHTDVNLVTKLLAHCIDAIDALGQGAGAYPIAPAIQNPLPPVGDGAFIFPVTGGELAPNFTDGTVETGGGQGLTKNNTTLVLTLHPSCGSEPPAVGTSILQTKFRPDFAINLLRADAQIPGGTPVPAPVAAIDFSTGTRALNGNQVTVTGATVTFHPVAAATFNTVFPNRSGDPANDFSGADLLGTIDLTATLR